jgi:transcriptional regulator with XRE-family HTH domain
MEKSTFTPQHKVFVELLRETRQSAGITQAELATKVRTSQSIVSKWERGELRLDLVQIQAVCLALGTSLSAFAQQFERRTQSLRRGSRGAN